MYADDFKILVLNDGTSAISVYKKPNRLSSIDVRPSEYHICAQLKGESCIFFQYNVELKSCRQINKPIRLKKRRMYSIHIFVYKAFPSKWWGK